MDYKEYLNNILRIYLTLMPAYNRQILKIMIFVKYIMPILLAISIYYIKVKSLLKKEHILLRLLSVIGMAIVIWSLTDNYTVRYYVYTPIAEALYWLATPYSKDTMQLVDKIVIMYGIYLTIWTIVIAVYNIIEYSKNPGIKSLASAALSGLTVVVVGVPAISVFAMIMYPLHGTKLMIIVPLSFINLVSLAITATFNSLDDIFTIADKVEMGDSLPKLILFGYYGPMFITSFYIMIPAMIYAYYASKKEKKNEVSG